MENPWNERYSKEEYIYGKLPNEFYAKSLSFLQPGKILFLGEGEGRNAVYAAKLGWLVDAFDYSSVAAEKAFIFAAEEKVEINYSVQDLLDFNPIPNSYDAAVLIFLHLQENLRKEIHEKVVRALKPGGIIILEAFEKTQMSNSSGGPKTPELLYGLEEIFSDFQDLDLMQFEKASPILDEGPLHQGKATTIRFLGKKKPLS